MDAYTRETRAWLERRFELADAAGIYVPNGPAYGFSLLAERLEQYARFAAILERLNGLAFDSLLEVGCADGYLAALAGRAFGVRAFGVELAAAGGRRARQLFDLPAAAADVHDLPLASGSVDLVLCSEVLEHVSDPARAASELVRVARRHVVVSTPVVAGVTEKAAAEAARDRSEPHAHLNHFTTAELAALLGPGTTVFRARSRPVAGLYRRAAADIDGSHLQRAAFVRFVTESAPRPEPAAAELRRVLIERYARPGRISPRAGRRLAAGLLRLDGLLARLAPAWTHDAVAVRSLNAPGGGGESRPAARRRVPPARLRELLLGGFRVAPLALADRARV